LYKAIIFFCIAVIFLRQNFLHNNANFLKRILKKQDTKQQFPSNGGVRGELFERKVPLGTFEALLKKALNATIKPGPEVLF